jgi:D-glycero-alpha-D-manno-heptose-7-phosphate kinase
MIISRTPFRVSFVGGGTDFPAYYREFGGAVLGSAIDKYVYHFVTRFPSKLFDYSIRLAYSKVEKVTGLNAIQHAPFREILRSEGVDRDVEISVAADLPSFSGLGSSSSFTVGLIQALNAFKGNFISQSNLASKAIDLERGVLEEVGGIQDQVFAAFGGFNLIEFSSTQPEYVVHRVPISSSRIDELEASTMMFFTGLTRKAQDVEESKITQIHKKIEFYKTLRKQVDKVYDVLVSNKNLSEFGQILNEAWMAKKNLSQSVTNEHVDSLYTKALEAGALGGKLLGAGGGGFLLLYVPLEFQESVRKVMPENYEIKIKMNAPGSSIIYSG